MCLLFTYQLKWYIRFRRPENSTRSLGKLQKAAKRLMEHMLGTLDFQGQHGQSVHNIVKNHWLVHAGGLIALLGEGRNALACPTEKKHSTALKRKERNTNQHEDTFGYSILKNNRRELGARAMMQDIAGTIWMYRAEPYGYHTGPCTYRYEMSCDTS